MKFIKKTNMLKELSTILPMIGGFILVVLIPVLEQAVEMNVIPVEYHATVTGVVIVALGMIGKKIYQPNLPKNQKEKIE